MHNVRFVKIADIERVVLVACSSADISKQVKCHVRSAQALTQPLTFTHSCLCASK